MTPRSYVVCGVRIDAFQLDDAVDQLLAWARDKRGRAVHLCNAYTLSLALEDADLAQMLDRGDANLTDGMPLVWIGRRLGFAHMRGRVYGPDLMLATMDQGRSAGARHYLYGSSIDVVSRLARNLSNRFPGVEIVGVESPPYRALDDDEEAALVERIRASAANIVWVGLGTPTQDRFVDRFRDRLPAVLVAVGAAFDFHAGAKRQAPRVVQRAGLEWLFRLAVEPRRLWRRYLIGNTRFVLDVLRHPPRSDDRD